MEKNKKERIIFRHATMDDVDKIAELEKIIFPDPWTHEFIYKDIESKISTYIVAEDTDIVAYLGYWVIVDECQINNVAVLPEFQKQGLGSLLMEKALSETEMKGAKIWTLEVRASNESAIALYEKYEFEKIALRKKYYEDGEDAILMQRRAENCELI